MLLQVNKILENWMLKITSYTVYTPILGMGRSIIALGVLLTLLFNDPVLLFNTELKEITTAFIPFQEFNFFILLKSNIVLANYIACVILLFVILGYYPQITCILHWYISYSFVNASLDIEGGDQIAANICLLLIPICVLDTRKNHWYKIEDSSIAVWRKLIANSWFWMIKIQVSIIYFHASIGKFSINEWINGTALYYWINHPLFGTHYWVKTVLNPLVLNEYGAMFSTWLILALEMTLAVSISWASKYKKALFVIGASFHFMIILLHGLFSFFIIMLGALVLYCLVDYYTFKIKNTTSQ